MEQIKSILGLGLSSLLAAHRFKDAKIFTVWNPNGTPLHEAVMRFKTPLVGELVGANIPLRTIHKGIWDGSQFVQPNIRVANQYSQRVVGTIAERSIWSAVGSCERYVPEQGFIRKLYDDVLNSERVVWCKDWHEVMERGITSAPAISTLPLDMWSGVQPAKVDALRPIWVTLHEVPTSQVYQTVYYPNHPYAYRATLDGSVLRVEYWKNPIDCPEYNEMITSVAEAFGLEDIAAAWDAPTNCIRQDFGKLVTSQLTYNESERRARIFSLTQKYRVYSLGRYATMRNIGLDQVAADIGKIEQLLEVDSYERRLRV